MIFVFVVFVGLVLLVILGWMFIVCWFGKEWVFVGVSVLFMIVVVLFVFVVWVFGFWIYVLVVVVGIVYVGF